MSHQQDNPQTTKEDDLAGLRCPKCDYELTGLANTNCPECGTEFDVKLLRMPPKSKHLEAHAAYARVICNIALANLIFQLFNSVMLQNEVLLVAKSWVTYGFVSNMASLGLLAGLLGGSIGFVTGLGVIVFAGVRYETKPSINGLATVLLSVAAAYLAIVNQWG